MSGANKTLGCKLASALFYSEHGQESSAEVRYVVDSKEDIIETETHSKREYYSGNVWKTKPLEIPREHQKVCSH